MSSNINASLTVPSELFSGKGPVTQTDHGPFYFFSPALPLHRVDMKDSVPHLDPCVATACTDWFERLPEEQCPAGTVIEWTVVPDQVGNRIKYGAVLKPADAQKLSILDMYTEWGVGEITSFAHRSLTEVDLSFFNSIIMPVAVEPWFVFAPELTEELDKKGGLKVRQDFVAAGRAFISGPDFANENGSERQALYFKATEEILDLFPKAAAYVTKELNASDNDIQLRMANAGGKPTYDTRDVYLQWLLARHSVMEKVKMTQTQAPIVVNVPESSGLGITKDELLAILSTVSETAARSALEAQRAARKPPVRSIITKKEEDVDESEGE